MQFAGANKYDLLKNEDGLWTVITPPQVPGFHYYFFVVDGVQITDPGSETYFGIGRQASAIEIPERGVDFYEVKNVPHGDIRTKWYFSKLTENEPLLSLLYVL